MGRDDQALRVTLRGSSPGTWRLEGTEPEPTSPMERPENARMAGAALVRAEVGWGGVAVGASCASRASLAAKGKNVSKGGPVGHSARSLGRSHPKRSLSKTPAFCLRKHFSVGGEGAGTGGEPGVCPLSPGTSRMRPQRRLHNPQKCLPHESKGRSLGICHPEVSDARVR